jgi:N-sulfoglucosamine sulfohydrolase
MPDRPRSVLLCIADDWSPIAGCYGNDIIRTPHVDALAQRATVFDHAFCTTPSCAASRASLLTGQHSHTHGQYGHCHSIHGFRTHAHLRTVPAVLRDAQIKSAQIGKSHIAPDHVYPFDFTTAMGPDPVPADGWSTRSLAETAERFLRGIGDQPFYLHAASLYPHRASGARFPADMNADEYGELDVAYRPEDVIVPDWMADTPESRQDLADYYTYVSRYDHFVGEMLRVLEASGRATDTLVIVMTDHGMPFVGAKASCFEAGHHCPLLIARPGGGAVRCDALVNWLDLAPTIYDWLGVPDELTPDDLPGRSLLPILDQPHPEGWDETTYAHNFHEVCDAFPYRVLRGRRYKFIQNLLWHHPARLPLPSDLYRSPTWQSVLERGLTQTGRVSVERTLMHDAEALFDLEADPLETRNLIDDPAHARIAADMRTRLNDYRLATRDPWLEVDIQAGRPGLPAFGFG